MKESYEKLLNSGMFWEFYPELSGEWEKDKEAWAEIEKGMIEKGMIDKKIDETFIDWVKQPSEVNRKSEFAKNWIEKQRTKNLKVQKDKFYSQVGDYLNNKFRGGIHYDSERMVFEVMDTHEQRNEIIEELTNICTYKL